MTNTITISKEDFAKLVAEAVAAELAASKGKAVKAAIAGKSERSMKNEILCVRAFKKAGFGDVKPHVDVMTYNRWVAAGRKVKPGEHGIRVKNLRLFHIKQTEAISAEEKAKLLADQQAAIAKYEAKKAGAIALNGIDKGQPVAAYPA